MGFGSLGWAPSAGDGAVRLDLLGKLARGGKLAGDDVTIYPGTSMTA